MSGSAVPLRDESRNRSWSLHQEPFIIRGCQAMRITLTGMILMAAVLIACGARKGGPDSESWRNLVARGEFTRAAQLINRLLAQPDLAVQERRELEFELERMARIRKDFNKSEADVSAFISKYFPDLNPAQLARWEAEKSLEMLRIDGEKRYFKNAARNLFRIDTACRQIWKQAHPDNPDDDDPLAERHLEENILRIIAAATAAAPFAAPVRLRIEHVITVNPGAVPAGQTIRCWIPFPREIPQRQTGIQLLTTTPSSHQLADNGRLQRTIYMEQPSAGAEPTRFAVSYEYTSFGSFTRIDPGRVQQVDPGGELKPWLQEEPPHILFTPELRTLARELTGDEKNPYLIAQKLYTWVEENVPWASAREYSTIPNLPMYAWENRHGDCGIQTLTFITLCRLSGIPARWQSGWEFKPPTDNIHDWGMIWFAPYGWLPMDVSYGRRDSGDPAHRWFYLSGMDSYRLIFNDAISQEFAPAKRHVRSETVDSQRGEVEWEGGNLYFDQWDYELSWQILEE